MDRQALNEIYYPLELKQAALVRALSHGGFGVESGWYNGHYHKDEAGNWCRESYPIPVIGVTGLCDIELPFDKITVSTKLKRMRHWRFPLKSLPNMNLKHTALKITLRISIAPNRRSRT